MREEEEEEGGETQHPGSLIMDDPTPWTVSYNG